MTLRRTASLLIILILLFSAGVIWGITKYVLTRQFQELEAMVVRDDMYRLHQSLLDLQVDLATSTRDYARWDDTYEFAQNPTDSEYIGDNAEWSTMANIGMEHFLIMDSLGQIVYHKGANLYSEGDTLELPMELVRVLRSDLSVFSRVGLPKATCYLQPTALGPFMIALDPITRTDGTSANGKWLLFVRSVGEKMQERLQERIRIELKILHSQDSLRNAHLIERLGLSSQSDGLYYRTDPVTLKGIPNSVGYLLAGRGEGVLFEVHRPRLIEKYGEGNLQFLAIALGGVGILLIFVLFVALERLILTPLEKLERNFLAIRESGDLFIRMPIGGPKEVQSLSRAINRMLEQFQVGQQHLLESEHRFRTLASELKTTHQFTTQLVNFLPDPTFAVDARGKVVAWNRAMEELTRTESESMIGRGLSQVEELIYGVQQPLLIESFFNTELGEETFPERRSDPSGAFQYEEFVAHLEGGCFLDQTAIGLRDERGGFLGALQTIRNVTHQKRAEMRLEFLSLHDPLTGLFNRTFFEESTSGLDMSGVVPAGVVLVDLDGLKLVNDTLGHDHGDALIIAASNLMQKAFVGLPVARMGGDEFLIFLRKSTEAQVKQGVNFLRQLMEEYNAGLPPLPVEMSVGYACTLEPRNLADLIKEADGRMYREKDQRRETVRLKYVHNLQSRFEEIHRKDRNMTTRLVDLGKRFGEYLQLDALTQERMQLLARFRDIGKVGLADRVMMKSGDLEKEEISEIRKQPEIGYRIAKISRDLSGIAELILKHREWYNGKGYPLGIAGEKIPLENRAVAVVEAYVAMTSPRHRSKSMNSEDALKEVVSMAGHKLDPDLVQRFREFLRR